ncbi:unnamed protein product [Thelazia callipaeda]|uniref:Mucin TcMUC n=1 Tax=Thelazia callipaeda TaxID=103827 RepID=A0A0N5D2S2_THECL|nr:unnamed protein product [Thelazia callipaeda]
MRATTGVCRRIGPSAFVCAFEACHYMCECMSSCTHACRRWACVDAQVEALVWVGLYWCFCVCKILCGNVTGCEKTSYENGESVFSVARVRVGTCISPIAFVCASVCLRMCASTCVSSCVFMYACVRMCFYGTAMCQRTRVSMHVCIDFCFCAFVGTDQPISRNTETFMPFKFIAMRVVRGKKEVRRQILKNR